MTLKNLYILLVIVILTSCNQNNFYFEQVNKINGSWNVNESKEFEFPVKNNHQKFTLYFVLRNNNDYKFSNIYFFTELLSPNGDIITDTLEYQLAYPDGRWIGFGMGDVKQNTLVFKENIQLQDTGLYKVNVKQAMRMNELQGIEDISLMVEKN